MTTFRFRLIPALLLLTLAVAPLLAQSGPVAGTIRDASGAAITKASVSLQSGSFRATTTTDATGHYAFAQVAGNSGSIEASADGFTLVRQSWNRAGNQPVQLDLVLQAASVSQQLTVSAARTEVRLGEAPGSTVLLGSDDIAATAALRADDALRQVPGFSLFRRSGSRYANASNQGVSLRGLGGTAASRALVLEDGLPIVDAFGGWVYWDRIPREALGSVEVFRGGASNLYGSDALGGVVQFITRQPQAPAFRLDTSFGNQRTPDFSLWTGTRYRKWDMAVAGDLFHTDGFVVIPDSLRGSVDKPAAVENAAVELTVGHQLGERGRVFARGNYLTEARQNGTPIQTNSTSLGEGALGLDQQFSSKDSVSLRFFGLTQTYNQNFSSVATDRNSESLTNRQRVPEQFVGGSAQWTHVLGRSQTLIAGMDASVVTGFSLEQLFSSGKNTRDNAAGGTQRNFGFYGEDVIRLGQKWTIVLAGRVDHWADFDASSICTPVKGTCPSPNAIYQARSQTAFDPRVSVLRSLGRNVSFTASVYRAFRAPTLNELYRTFRVGSVLTNNNPELIAERLTGGEAGLKVTGWANRLDLRGTFFWSEIANPVQNVTLTQTPSLITRQKENLGSTRARGLELDGVFHVNHDLQFSAGYEYTAATITSYPNPPVVSLAGLDVAQVPRHVFTWQARYWNPRRILLSAQGRFVGRQFDDDVNQFPLDSFYTMDVQVGRNVTRNVEVYGAAENVFNQRYQVAKTPIVNLGPPVLYRVGLRFNFPSEH